MKLFVMKAAMKIRPYLMNDPPLPAGYWREFFTQPPTEGNWIPPKTSVQRKSGPIGDVLGWIGGVPLFSARARELLETCTGGTVDFVKYGDIKGAPFWVISRMPVVLILSKLDVESVGPVFCVHGNELTEVLVKHEIPALVVQRGFTGFQFRTAEVSHLGALFRGEDVNAYPGALP